MWWSSCSHLSQTLLSRQEFRKMRTSIIVCRSSFLQVTEVWFFSVTFSCLVVVVLGKTIPCSEFCIGPFALETCPGPTLWLFLCTCNETFPLALFIVCSINCAEGHFWSVVFPNRVPAGIPKFSHICSFPQCMWMEKNPDPKFPDTCTYI